MDKNVKQYHEDRKNYLKLLKHYKNYSPDCKSRRIVKKSLLVSVMMGLIPIGLLMAFEMNLYTFLKRLVFIGTTFGTIFTSILFSNYVNEKEEEQIILNNQEKTPPTKEEVKEAETKYALSKINKKYRK